MTISSNISSLPWWLRVFATACFLLCIAASVPFAAAQVHDEFSEPQVGPTGEPAISLTGPTGPVMEVTSPAGDPSARPPDFNDARPTGQSQAEQSIGEIDDSREPGSRSSASADRLKQLSEKIAATRRAMEDEAARTPVGDVDVTSTPLPWERDSVDETPAGASVNQPEPASIKREPAPVPVAVSTEKNISQSGNFSQTTETRTPAGLTDTELEAGKASDTPARPLGPRTNQKDGSPSTNTSLVSWESSLWAIGALVLVVGLIYVLKTVLMRMSGKTPASVNSPVLDVLTRVSISPKSNILVLRMSGRLLLVGESASGLQPIANIDDPDEVAHILKAVESSKPNSISASFGDLLGRYRKDHDEEYEEETGGDRHEVAVDAARDQISRLRTQMRSSLGKGRYA